MQLSMLIGNLWFEIDDVFSSFASLIEPARSKTAQSFIIQAGRDRLKEPRIPPHYPMSQCGTSVAMVFDISERFFFDSKTCCLWASTGRNRQRSLVIP